MRKIIFYVFVLTFITGWCSCNRKSQFRERLTELDALLIKHPDSVYGILNGMADDARKQTKADYMYYELMRADAQNKADILFATDSIMQVVADYYAKNGTSNEKMRAYYLLGCTYRDLKDVPMELECFQMATEIADTTKTDCDLYTLNAIYGQMADIYFYQDIPREELKAWDMCERTALKDKDTLSAIVAYELRLRAYYMLGMHDSVLIISEKARERYLAVNDKMRAASLLGPAISILMDRGNYEKAHEYMKIFEAESEYFTDGEINAPNAYIYYWSMGRYALHCGKRDSAKYYFDKLVGYGLKEAGYQGLMLLYQNEEKTDSIVKYSKLYADANDSSHINDNTQKVAQLTAMYDYGRTKRIAEATKNELLMEKGKTLTLLVVTFGLVLVVLTMLYVTARIRKNNINRIIELNREIEHKTALLSEALDNRDDELLEKMKASLEKSQRELQKYRKADMLRAFYETDIYKLLKKMSVMGGDYMTREEWKEMARLFEATFSAYTDYLHSAKALTPDQQKVCMLIRMGFGETEMANIMSVDLKRITRIKMQINQKLFDTPSAKDLILNLKPHF